MCVVGPVSVRTYEGNDGNTRAILTVNANEIEFLSGRNDEPRTDSNGYQADEPSPEPVPDNTPQSKDEYVNVSEDVEDELPF